MDIRFRAFETPCRVVQVSKGAIGNLIEPATGPKQFDDQEIDMTTDDAMRNKPILYWVALAMMFTAFVAVAMS